MAAAQAYPVRVDASLDAPLSRWLWLVKWVLVIPHYIVLAFLWVAFVVLSAAAMVAIVVTGRYLAVSLGSTGKIASSAGKTIAMAYDSRESTWRLVNTLAMLLFLLASAFPVRPGRRVVRRQGPESLVIGPLARPPGTFGVTDRTSGSASAAGAHGGWYCKASSGK